MNILVVDDESILLKHLIKILNEILPNAEITGFSQSNKAIEFANDNKIDIAFLDIQMIGMTGVELAATLQKSYPKMNIIFTTGYDSYALDAFKLNASAYLLKPITKDSVIKALENLRYPILDKKEIRTRFQCFGNFEVFIDSKPVEFKFSKTKELLAYLVYKRGALCSNEEIISVLWEDFSNHSSYFKQLRQDLNKTLCDLDCENIIIRQRGKTAISTDLVECDYYDYLDGEEATIKEFMSQYPWAEEVTGLLN